MTQKKENKQMGWKEIFEVMLKDRRIRLSIVKKLHKFFFYFYFPHYTEFEIAPFHEEMFRITQDTSTPTAVILGFRGCGKSALLSMSFPLWAILGEQKIKYVLILSQTQQKAQILLQQIKNELEVNELLKKDLGPFQEERNQWNVVSLCLTRYNAKIAAASTEQSIRSWRHMQYRPQLIICDDLEDLESVKTQEGRDKLCNWLLGDVIPAGSRDTRLIILGGLLHEDSLPRRLQKSMTEEKMDGVYHEYPILDENGNPTWPGKFRTPKDIEAEKRKIGNEITWQREYMLRIIPDEGQLIRSEWIQFYDELPSINQEDYQYTWAGLDLAVSEKSTADYTAIVAAQVHGQRRKRKIYILPNPVNKRMLFPDVVDLCRDYLNNFLRDGKLIVESTACQASLSQLLHREGRYVEGVPARGEKRSRLAFTSPLIQNGTILFPKKGAEELIQQLIGFGAEKHDDLVDAFTLLIHQLVEDDNKARANVWYLRGGSWKSVIHYDDEWEDEDYKDKRISKREDGGLKADQNINKKADKTVKNNKGAKGKNKKNDDWRRTFAWHPSVFEDNDDY